MKERKFDWPLVNRSEVEEKWWDEVTTSTAVINDLFSPDIPEDADFTIRSIAHVVMSYSQEDVAWYLEGSLHQDQGVAINRMIHSDNPTEKQEGMEALKGLVENYIKDYKEYEEDNE